MSAWQKIDQDATNAPARTSLFTLKRLRLPHGWLVRTYFEVRERTDVAGVPPDIDASANVSITFVPLGPSPWN